MVACASASPGKSCQKIRRAVGMERPVSTLAVGWQPLLLLLSLPVMVTMAALKPPENRQAAPKAVGDLIANSAVKFGVVQCFKDLDLPDGCTSPLVYESDFPKSLAMHYESSMCTIIHNMTKEIEMKTRNMSDNSIETMRCESDQSIDLFKVWKNVSKVSESQSLNLLMEHLNETDKLKSVCYNFNGNLFPYCKFLHLEVLLMQNIFQINETIKKPIVSDYMPIKMDKSSTTSPPVVTDFPGNADIATNHDYVASDDKNAAKNDYDQDDPNKLIEFNESEKQPDEATNELKNPNPIDKNQNEDSNIIDRADTNIAQPISSIKLTNQEESHFLLYFIIITILSMIFYLAIYNKKKIIALLIEGRRSTNHRRRPNSTSYSKVETDDGSTVY